MGAWIIAKGRLEIEPKPDKMLISDFNRFVEETCPPAYFSEKLENPWFFDENNNLISCEGQFGEPCVWYYHLKDNFFRLWGYILKGDPELISAMDEDYKETCRERNKEYKKWLKRKDDYNTYSPRYYG